MRELEFVDDARRELVDLLEQAYLRVASTSVPEWISIEAPSGWGKSRLVHELYRRLAATQQDDGAFWPPSLAGAMVAGAEGDDPGVDAVRKRTFPEQLSPEQGATPGWLWWGIGCDHRYGTPLQALANDIGQIERLTGVLEQRWRRQASVLDKTRVAFTRRQGELVDTAVGEGVSAAAGVLGAAVPGLGFVVLAAKWGIRKLKEPSPDRVEAGLNEKLDLVDEVAPGIARFAREVVPVVIFVEDLHRADASLIELLSRLMNSTQARVLLVTTAWPGQIDNHGCAAHELLQRVPRVERWASHGSGSRVVAPLATESAAMLVAQLLPWAPPDVQAGLVERYPNPLALQLACRSQALRQALAGRGDAVSVVGRLPREVRQLYEMLWDDLPAAMRTLCMVSVLSAPATVSTTWGAGDDRWDADAVLAAAAVVPWLQDQLVDLEADLAQHDPYGWVRSVSEWLRRFHEPVQREVALAAVREQYDDPYSELAPFIEQMAERLVLDTTDPELALHHARLLVALQAEGFIPDTDAWWNAVQHLARWLADQPDIASKRGLVALTTAALAHARPDDEPGQLLLRALRATGSAEVARSQRDIGNAVDRLREAFSLRQRAFELDPADERNRAGVVEVLHSLMRVIAELESASDAVQVATMIPLAVGSMSGFGGEPFGRFWQVSVQSCTDVARIAAHLDLHELFDSATEVASDLIETDRQVPAAFVDISLPLVNLLAISAHGLLSHVGAQHAVVHLERAIDVLERLPRDHVDAEIVEPLVQVTRQAHSVIVDVAAIAPQALLETLAVQRDRFGAVLQRVVSYLA